MIDGVSKERILNLTDREKRWLDNIKKAVLACDRAFLNGEKRDRCFPELCNAIDTAKTLERSLRGEDTSPIKNKARFLEFFGGVSPDDGGYRSGDVVDSRNGKNVRFTIGELVYAIRCMCHENENLDADDRPDYHILLNWTGPFLHQHHFVSQFENERIEVNAELLLDFVRGRVAGFVTKIDSYIAFAESGCINISCAPPLGSIRPGENFVYANQE
ncbi:hypothetical protein [Rhodopirellula sp. MGV]|uniref:hypothetical protein n=1 Tax=Rhodopirellula sp. MGV TaxID=2023130 RepID=UPI000B97C133|nr:hypothetical protein [Rhodopirellula sp. MGV]OYP35382.1 hypothetical protein CGZ80_11980 [Rhodopirellula sp. MGV]PNY37729.1 hypothetical protein C2E31_06235 [Rhodopirellula baltica]